MKVNKKKKTKLYLTSLIFLGIGGVFLGGSYFEKKQSSQSLTATEGQFSNDNATIAIKVDGQKTDKIPDKNSGKNFEKAECTDGATGIWDKNNWTFTVKTTKKTKCTLFFSANEVEAPSTKSMKDILQNQDDITNGKLIEDTNDSDTNLRYIGANPNNYVYFNCDDLSNQNSNTCETWRIIGLMNVETASGEQQQLLKIIRDSIIGEYSWDSSTDTVNYGYGINEWSQADIQKVLNDNYFYRKTGGTCYNGMKNTEGTCPEWTTVGIKNSARSLVENVKWKTGTMSESFEGNESQITPLYMYSAERSTANGKQCTIDEYYCNDTVERTTEFIGHVGLMYPSDFGYATSGGTVEQRKACLATSLNKWRDNNCITNDWLQDSTNAQWTLTPTPNEGEAYSMFFISPVGGVGEQYAFVAFGIRPVVYLKSYMKISKGTGSSSDPFQLSY